MENRLVLSYEIVVLHSIMLVISTIYVVDTRCICVCSSMPHRRIPIGAGWDSCRLYQVKGEETSSLLGKSKLAFWSETSVGICWPCNFMCVLDVGLTYRRSIIKGLQGGGWTKQGGCGRQNRG